MSQLTAEVPAVEDVVGSAEVAFVRGPGGLHVHRHPDPPGEVLGGAALLGQRAGEPADRLQVAVAVDELDHLVLAGEGRALVGVAGDFAGLQRPELVGDALGRGGLGTATAHQGDDSEGQRRRQQAGVVGEATEGGCRVGVHLEPL
jgi:hypothetical protein